MSTRKETKKEPLNTEHSFPVIGIGASAGGLDAFKKLIKAIPEKSGMAYVFVQHLLPNHGSVLTEILERETSTPVHEITDSIPLAPDHIYIIPSNKILTAVDGVLKLHERDKKVLQMPIDIFFTSLADVYGNNANGVVLSGTASDGTAGLKAIKENGGITVAQEPSSAAFPAMPENAIHSGMVDFILPPEEIPGRLLQVINYYNHHSPQKEDLDVGKEDARLLHQITMLIHQFNGIDFSYYKKNTLLRRIARRMAINKISLLEDYYTFLQGNKKEMENLFRDLLITVTSFFRDKTVFAEIGNSVLPEIIHKRSAGDPIRVWIAGCASGEEAYSIAICLEEVFNKRLNTPPIQIFASDISEDSIRKARSGIYSAAEIQGISEDRLKKYFVKTDGSYEIIKTIREKCIFAVHNFLTDPPFAKMDLISCRNVLIYMDVVLQRRALATFHYALKPKGFMILGKSETTGPVSELFTTYNKSEKIYRGKNLPGKFRPMVTQSNSRNYVPQKRSNDSLVEDNRTTARLDFRKNAESILLAEYTPAAVVVNEHLDIVYIHGKIAPYLQPSSGTPTFNVLKMAHEGLAFELRNAIHKAKTGNKTVLKDAIKIKENGGQQSVSIEVVALKPADEPHYLILFRNGESPVSNSAPADYPASQEKQERIAALEKELQQVRHDMREITEEQESANEELQSANEELQSSNEEMQSLNEELETSQEELQSTNEELLVVNQELLDNQQQLNTAKHFSESVVETIREPLLVINKASCIVSANAAYYKVFKTSEQESIGKYLFDVGGGQWDNTKLRRLLENNITEKIKIEDFEIENDFQRIGRRTMLLNSRYIVNHYGKEELILLAIEDITERKNAEQKMKSYSDDLEKEVEKRTSDLVQLNLQLSQFAHLASHDLQEPLRKIETFSSRLLENFTENLSPEIQTYLHKIDGSAARMRKLINELLAYSRLISYENLFVLTDLNVVLENVLSDFELIMEEKKAKITSNDLPVLQAIPLQMNQLFYNLIMNSLKFSREDIPPIITITSSKLSDGQVSKLFPDAMGSDYYEIIFRDNGIGFNQNYASQIFDVFQQLHHTEEFAGSGIGLSIIKRIVGNHYGHISVEAKENEGAAFHVILPAYKEL